MIRDTIHYPQNRLFTMISACVFLFLIMTWKPLKGIVTPLSTPLLTQDTIDETGTRNLIEHVIDGGVSGIFVLGSTGEGPSLSYEARRKFVSFCCKIVGGRVPVLVCISDTSFGEMISFAKFASDAGASAVVLTQPFYFTMGQTEMIQYTEKALEALPDGLPVMLYNIPFLTKSTWDVETVRTLALRHKQIVGIKDSGGDLAYFEHLCSIKKDRPDFTIMIGPEHLLPEAMQAGGDGGVNGGSNVFPRLFSLLYKSIVDGEGDQKIESLKAGVNQLQEIYSVGSATENPFSRFISGTKCALAAKGICGMYVNQPFSSYDDGRLANMKGIVSQLEHKLKEIM